MIAKASNRCLRCSPSAVSNGRSRSTSRNSRTCRAESRRYTDACGADKTDDADWLRRRMRTPAPHPTFRQRNIAALLRDLIQPDGIDLSAERGQQLPRATQVPRLQALCESIVDRSKHVESLPHAAALPP